MTAGRRTALLEVLDGYRGGDRGDDAAISRFRAFLERRDPFRREDPDGHVTASAVVARPRNVPGPGPAGLHATRPFEFLLVFHRKLDRWLQPGGHVEEGDTTVFDTAVREAREETGIPNFGSPLGDAILDLDVHAIPEFGGDPAHFHFDVRFLLTSAHAGELAPGAEWFPYEAVGPVDTDGSLSRAVRKAIARLAAP